MRKKGMPSGSKFACGKSRFGFFHQWSRQITFALGDIEGY